MGILGRLHNLLRIGKPAVEVGEVDLEGIQNLLGYRFRDESLLLMSLTHRSFSHINETSSPSNERLEFLGDSVLGLIIADQLFRDYPGVREGELTKTRSMLVSETALTTVGKEIGFNRYLRLSPEEDRTGGRERSSIVSDAVESIIAAVYIDGGIEAARDVILKWIYSRRDKFMSDSAQHNYKGELLEISQARGDGIPHYEVISEEGPDHFKKFKVAVHLGDRVIGFGTGLSKKEAEQKAASSALKTTR
ncbi:MAG: ribonuclease III [candidate division Zixibacteria bacterium]|nr:ribonuclease III [candidate division Zixibacteria bacterium]